MKCILHIGTEKTGSTLLQEWLYANQSALSQQGIFISDFLGRKNNRGLVAFINGQLESWGAQQGLHSEQDKNDFFANFDHNFRQEITSAELTHTTFVITSEHFHSRLTSAEQIKSLAEYLQQIFDQIEIICYFREQSQMARSLYSTALKSGASIKPAEFIAKVTPSKYYYNFKAIADNWSQAFGRENCHFQIYDRTRFREGDIRKDFISLVSSSIDSSALNFTIASSNESLSRLQADILRAVNKTIPARRKNLTNNPANQRLRKRLLKIGNTQHGNIKIPQLNRIAADFRASNKQFFDTYFDGEYLFTPPKPGNSEEKRFSLDEVSKLLTEVLQVSLQHGRQEKLKALKK